MSSIIEFQNFEKRDFSEVMVLGVGGAGCNAVNHMMGLGIKNITYMICNTDRKTLALSSAPIKLQLGNGLGAGNNPEKARNAALEQLDEIVETFRRENTKVVFVTAGMGGGTGTGAAHVIAKAAHELGILTIAIVSLPLSNEGPKRTKQAITGLDELKKYVDSIVVIHNDNIPKIYGSLPMREALKKADNVLASAATNLAELITRYDEIAVDLEDVRTVMLNGGITLMGSAQTSGEDRIDKLVTETLNSPVLNYQDIRGAQKILLHISYGSQSGLTLSETTQILSLIQQKVGKNRADIIWGAGEKAELVDEIALTVIATGFEHIDLTVYPPDSQAKQKNSESSPENDGMKKERKIGKWLDTIFGDGENSDTPF